MFKKIIEKLKTKFNIIKLRGFSPVELIVMVITVSVIAASMTPVVTKKMTQQKTIAINPNQITERCIDKFGEFCHHCTESKCLECSIHCSDTQRVNVEECRCEPCVSK